MLDDSFKIRYKAVPVAISQTKKIAEDTLIHNHSEFEILLIEKGKSEINISGKKYDANEGDMIFINPLEVHSVYIEDKKNYSHKCICFDCSLILDHKIKVALTNEALKIKHHIESKSPHKSTLENYFFGIIKAHGENGKYSKTEAISYISLMFSYIMKNNLTDNLQKKSKDEIFCKKALKYTEEHYFEDISSKHAADTLSYNQCYFCRTFKKNFGRSFSSYLNFYRISKARSLLENDEKSITDIALECGFNTPSYFSKCFKSELGILPSEYRH